MDDYEPVVILWRAVPFSIAAVFSIAAAMCAVRSPSRWALGIGLTVFAALFWAELFGVLTPVEAIEWRRNMGGVIGWLLAWTATVGFRSVVQSRRRAEALRTLGDKLAGHAT